MKELCIDKYNRIRMEGLKVVDICIGSGYEGCMCSATNDRNRYDKESQTIVCKHYSDCLLAMIRKMPETMFQELCETIEDETGRKIK